jgi:hypothetical protein
MLKRFVKIKLIRWIPVTYWCGILVYYLIPMMWGTLGVIRPSPDGKIDADYCSVLVSGYYGQAVDLYTLIFIGFLLSVIVNFVMIKLKV